MNIQFLNADCMDPEVGLPSLADNAFDLAIVDPPYGISQPAFRAKATTKLAAPTNYNHSVFEQPAPDRTYFDELRRVSRNQIIWGANYYNQFLPAGNKWLFWDKGTEATRWGDGELAYTSFPGAITKIRFVWNGMLQGDMKHKECRIHPTQKPVKLYQRLLNQFTNPGDLILDTHVGSASSLIACQSMGFTYLGYELDPDYYAAAKRRMRAGVQKALL